MRLTNRMNLPEPLVEAVKNDGYSRGPADISVTELLSPARQAALKRQHEAQLVEDASDRIWSLLGQAVHQILERANANDIAERRLSIQIEGWRISGGMDLYHGGGTLSDYKVTTAWKFKRGQVPEEFEAQLNCYAEILRQNGEKVKRLQVVGILRDWSKLEAMRDPEYPQSQVVVLPVALWEPARALKFMRERVILHKKARAVLPECSSQERWAKPPVFAVMKRGQKRAVKLYGSRLEAVAHAATDKGLFVLERVGQNVRCDAYCAVKDFCSQYKALLNEQYKSTMKQYIAKEVVFDE